ncbi:protein FAM241B isoform X1 [Mirounga angustirostris]|uniref:protein FAM241B isoform X1 n=1 Tax=Mirounga angustirostris TaxID=9716 RepID=UPI00313B1312
MVRILANGEIVQDDDPRVRNSLPSRGSTPRQMLFASLGWKKDSHGSSQLRKPEPFEHLGLPRLLCLFNSVRLLATVWVPLSSSAFQKFPPCRKLGWHLTQASASQQCNHKSHVFMSAAVELLPSHYLPDSDVLTIHLGILKSQDPDSLGRWASALPF